MKKDSIQQEDTIANIYAPNLGAPKYTKQVLMHIENPTVINDSRGLQHPIYHSDHPERKLIRKQ